MTPTTTPNPNPPPRQTLSYLHQLLEARGLRPNGKLGQCFLIDLNLLDLIVRSGEVGPEDLVLEVGTGTGGMTARLAEQAAGVLGVEIDRGFYELTRDHVAAWGNIKLIQGDVLESKNRLNPEVLETLRNGLANNPAVKRLKLVANLPYVVATPVISNLLLTDLPFERFAVTIQWELAERLAASPSTKDYNALSVLVQSLADVEIVRQMPPQAFWPRPKVNSGIVIIRPSAAKRALIADLAGWHRFLHDLYLHRRKNLRGVLLILNRERFTKDALDALLTANGFDPTGRAEALTVADHLKLYNTLRQP